MRLPQHRLPQHRLPKAGLEILRSGKTVANPQRMGSLTFEARLMGLETILAIQPEVNAAARAQRRPEVDRIKAEEEGRIRHASGTHPRADRNGDLARWLGMAMSR